MVMIGVDPHKATHTAVAVDSTEEVLGERLVRATPRQVAELVEWAKRLDGGDRHSHGKVRRCVRSLSAPRNHRRISESA